MEYGVLQLGDPSVQLGGQTVLGPVSMYQFSCPNVKAKKAFTLYTHRLHMHKSGARMKTVHYRRTDPAHVAVAVGGSEIEFYDFDYQDITYKNETVLPGDSFTTQCW